MQPRICLLATRQLLCKQNTNVLPVYFVHNAVCLINVRTARGISFAVVYGHVKFVSIETK